ncbi:MAG: hypothetical protein L6V93_00200 [Clostridiales bacterium]|nr:MAG: hypothetical protein L6V93_00200 [Clostridiales bacterium]
MYRDAIEAEKLWQVYSRSGTGYFSLPKATFLVPATNGTMFVCRIFEPKPLKTKRH